MTIQKVKEEAKEFLKDPKQKKEYYEKIDSLITKVYEEGKKEIYREIRGK